MWKWVVYYIQYSDTSNKKQLSERTYESFEAAMIALSLSQLLGNLGLPKDAIILEAGVTNHWREK